MRLSTSTCLVFNRPGGRKASIEDCIRLCAGAGYTVMDMNFHDCATFETPLWHSGWESWVHTINETAQTYGIEFSQAHSHFYNYCDPAITGRDVYDEKIRRGIIGAGILGIPWTVIHAATDFGSATPVASSKKKALEYFKPLLELAAEHNVGIAIENLWELNISPQRRYTTTAEELVDLVDSLPFSNVGICWDAEHADIMQQDQLAALSLVGDRLKATHISDNKGRYFDHLLPFAGTTDWPAVMKALKAVGYSGDFTYEVLHYIDNTPDELVPGALRYSVDIGNYLLSL
ncbi:sugar phosphate isomerase/epimerase family protein [Breznakiella homolactica]|uniref:Sugar phosphate isomerase/epimerase n=1 Tax=Breznakiella homolactica TaxID=2798577 RepID=A0A7T7XLG7_9SPIR|nr:sugar phosphate isomerase/epimerase [Breznakiella homolactica]QQO08457.1 sugar phosphate isomerase/epimerase [Breznakiella homolactica]